MLERANHTYPPPNSDPSIESSGSQNESEAKNQKVFFFRCDEFMDTVKSPTQPLVFVDESQQHIEEVIHCWPLASQMIPHFLNEEKESFPNRNYYQIDLPDGWYVYALNWQQLDLYLSHVSTWFSNYYTEAPDIEEFDPNEHLGSVDFLSEQEAKITVPYQVVLSPRKISSYY